MIEFEEITQGGVLKKVKMMKTDSPYINTTQIACKHHKVSWSMLIPTIFISRFTCIKSKPIWLIGSLGGDPNLNFYFFIIFFIQFFFFLADIASDKSKMLAEFLISTPSYGTLSESYVTSS